MKEQQEEMREQIAQLKARLDQTEQSLPFTCTEHKSMAVILFCAQCKMFLCSVCLSKSHQKHELQPIQAHSESVIANL